ncbi:MAG TPA: hypothetical protein VEQ63_09665, partial [Bryobacteraceae bacterium]|nr:hypothetical protein [Bryobacteraceae bacterium]
EVTDIFGQTAAQGFRISRLNAATRGVLVGAGGSVVNTPLGIPAELGMHTIVVELRDYAGNQVIKSAYAKISVVDEVVQVTGNVDANATWVSTKSYNLNGIVFVRNNSVLTIQPGTVITGTAGSPPGTLVVTRGARLEASGTKSRPIIMTSSRPVGQRQRGDWGGLVLLGSAPTNQPDAGRFAEGFDQSPTVAYGGNDPASSCGTLRYLRSEFAGFTIGTGNEINSFSFYSCGTGTVAEHLQAHYGADDSFEWFGGTMNAKYLVATYGDDDYFDIGFGWQGNVQFALGVQAPDAGSRGIEADNNEASFALAPIARPSFYNVTLIGSGVAGTEDSSLGLLLRRGVQGAYNNFIVQNFGVQAIQITDDATFSGIDQNQLTANGFIVWNNARVSNGANTPEAQIHSSALPFAQGTRGTGRQFIYADPMLRNPLGYSGGDWMPMASSPVYRANWVLPPDNGFFDQSARFVGAIGKEDWTEEWTTSLLEEDIRIP